MNGDKGKKLPYIPKNPERINGGNKSSGWKIDTPELHLHIECPKAVISLLGPLTVSKRREVVSAAISI
jgi:hypothetical protein